MSIGSYFCLLCNFRNYFLFCNNREKRLKKNSITLNGNTMRGMMMVKRGHLHVAVPSRLTPYLVIVALLGESNE
jgi:hypothetical protein